MTSVRNTEYSSYVNFVDYDALGRHVIAGIAFHDISTGAARSITKRLSLPDI